MNFKLSDLFSNQQKWVQMSLFYYHVNSIGSEFNWTNKIWPNSFLLVIKG